MRNEKTSSKRRTKLIADIVTYIGLAIYFLILVLPFIIIIITSFASDYEISHSIGFVWAPKFSTEGYEVLFKNDPYAVGGVPSILRGFLNTLWMTTIPTVVGLLVSGAAAYVYAKVKVPGKNILFMIEIATMSIPLGAFGMVSYLFYQNIGWVGTVLPIIIPGLFGSAGQVFFLSMFYIGLSKEIFEAAKLDGCSTLGIFFKIVMPLAKPAFIAQFVLAFCSAFNNYSGALLYLSAVKEMWPLQLALQQVVAFMSRSGGGYTNVQCGAAVISIVPMLILYLCTQKYFLEGIAVGGGKE